MAVNNEVTAGAAFATHQPPEPLRPYVAAAHSYRVPANPTGLHRGLPSRHVTLVLELLSPLRIDGLGAGPVAAHGVVGGLHLRPARIDATRQQEGVQYALTPLGCLVLLGVPAAELPGLAVDLGDLLGRDADALMDGMRATADPSARFRLLDETLLRRRTHRHGNLPPEVAEAWRLIFGVDGRVRVKAVAAHVGWSRRHLTERFRLSTGITPKQAARIARFEAARRLLLSADRPPLADVASRAGYADQAHLARDWHQFAGCTVSTWLREELPFVQDVEAPDDAPSSA